MARSSRNAYANSAFIKGDALMSAILNDIRQSKLLIIDDEPANLEDQQVHHEGISQFR